MKVLKLLMAATAVVTMAFTAQAAKTAKAVVVDGGKTLKFVYDETNYGTKDKDWFSVAEAEALEPGYNPPWWDLRGTVTKVLFDGSFAGYRPGHCAWFMTFAKLATVEGLENLDVSEATSLTMMFCQCESLTSLDLSGFNTVKATGMDLMFYGCKNLKTILVSDAFTTAAVTASGLMFYNCTALKGGNGTAFDSSKVDKTYARIDKPGAPGYFTRVSTAKAVVADGGKTLRFVYDNLDYGTKGTDWFAVAEAEAIDPRYDDVPWYGRCSDVTKVVFADSFKDYRPKQCSSWFRGFANLATIENIGNLDTSNVTDMRLMFDECSSLTTLDVSGFDTSKVTSMRLTFDDCSSLTTLYLSGFDTSNVTDMYGMFFGCSSLTSLDLSGFDTSNVTNMNQMFYGCSSLTSLDVTGFNTANVTDMTSIFSSCRSLKSLNLSGFDTAKVTSMYYMFGFCSSLTTIVASDAFVTTVVINSNNMFGYCTKLVGGNGTEYDSAKTDKEYARIDGGPSAPGYFTEKLKTAKVVVEDGGKTLRFVYDNKDYGTKDADWFSVAEAEKIDSYEEKCVADVPWYGKRSTVTKVVFDPSFAAYRPKQCASWFIDFGVLVAVDGLTNLDTSFATNMAYMFYGCKALKSLDVSGFITSMVTDMRSMFDSCLSLTTLDVTGFDTANVTRMYAMFRDCSSLTTLDVSGFDTANVTTMYCMFDGCSSLTALDVSGFDTSNVTDMGYMFYGCSSLTMIIASDSFKSYHGSKMFKDCTALVGGAGTAYDSTNTDATYARIDGGPSAPGYFTRGAVYTVAFVGNGATSGSMPSHKYGLGKVYNLPKCAFKKTGKAFKGWAGSNGRRYDDGVLVFNAVEEGETVTMTAIWK